jgi:hypothetical protein
MRCPALAAAIAALPSIALFASCAAVGGLPGTDPSAVPAIQHLGVSGSYSYHVDLGSTPRDLYFVFTNTDLQNGSSKPSVGAIVVDGRELPAPAPQDLADPTGAPVSAMDKIRAFAKSPKELTRSALRTAGIGRPAPPRASDIAGVSTGPYNVYNVGAPVQSTCRKVVGPIATAQGPRTLNIWVADDCWNGGGEGATGTKEHGVTQAMVDVLAGKFLFAGAANDIYDWVTAILGPEWGATAFGYLIAFDGEITILLSDIGNDNSDNGGTVGYFDATNNFSAAAYSASNQRIMFVVDAVMYANPNANGTSSTGGSGWDSGNYWAEEVFSTLAHEFQHMIHFYQKGVLARGDGSSADTWIDEMCAQLVEDLVADNMGLPGPRGLIVPGAGSYPVSRGRIPSFNALMSRALTVTWPASFSLADYSTAYSFGAFLARNYGGAPLVRAIVHDSAADSACITKSVSAVAGRTLAMGDLLEKWAVSVLASNRTDMPPGYRYNSGTWFASSSGGLSYSLGSIDFFNYDPPPDPITADGALPSSGSFSRASNLYYLAASGASGKKSFSVTVPKGVAFSTYATP